MSNSETGTASIKQKSDITLSIVGIVGSFLLFALILALAYLPGDKQSSVDMNLRESRKQMLAQNQAEQKDLLTSYEVVDAQNGIVRIPLEQAIDLTIAEMAEEAAK